VHTPNRSIYEVVSGQILLGKRDEFMRLHRDVLAPMLSSAGIETVLCLITEIGRNGRFLDVYKYPTMSEYERRTDQLLESVGLTNYYAEVAQCIHGAITVELALEFPHTRMPEG
jgi:hypothetical protein